jgi:hypothetical protein
MTAVRSSGWKRRRECCYVIQETLSKVLFFSILFIGERKRFPLLLHHKFEKGKSFFIGLGSTSSVFEFNVSEKCMQMFVFKQENVFDFAFYIATSDSRDYRRCGLW